MRKKIANYFLTFFCCILRKYLLTFRPTVRDMAKKRKIGRPVGSEKEPVNVYMRTGRAQKLRDLAVTEQKTISILVENALETTYGI